MGIICGYMEVLEALDEVVWMVPLIPAMMVFDGSIVHPWQVRIGWSIAYLSSLCVIAAT